jgi:hypothetical protein
MGLLSPTKSRGLAEPSKYNLEPENEILRSAGLIGKKKQDNELIEKLENQGLGLSASLDNLYNITNNARNEHVRLHAVRTALELHGHLRGREGSEGHQQIIFEIKSNNVQLNQILAPQRNE